jgi:hypothetical protein
MVRAAIHNGTTINGQRGEPWPLAPTSDDDRW